MLKFKELMERINITKAKMGDVIKDFQDSDAPQFKGKSAEKRREMAIAAKLEADRGVKEETGLEEGSYKEGETRMGSVGPITTDAERAERAKKYREKMMKKEKKPKPVKEAAERQISRDEYHRAGGNNNRMQYTTGDEKNKKYWTRTPVREEAEQIDELSTPTLQSYRKKARAQGNAIVDKMKMGGGDWSKDQKDTKTLRKRAAGAQMSGKTLRKRGESLKTEETQIDELSRERLTKYKKQAEKQSGQMFKKMRKHLDRAARIGISGSTNSEKSAKETSRASAAYNKGLKRISGAAMAAKKLSNEEVEQTAEELKGNQHKIDANKNGKIDGNDFKILRNAKKARYQ